MTGNVKHNLPFRLAVFDLDGVIVDSEPAHESVRGDILYALSGGKTRSLGHDPTGTDTAAYYADFIAANGAPGTGEDAAKRHYEGVLNMICESIPEPIPGVLETLQVLKDAGVRLAVASSSPEFYVRGVLEHFSLLPFFCAVASGDEVARLKPAPDVYALALSRAGFAPGDAIAIEDSRSGLMAALAANLVCVGYIAPAIRPQNLCGAYRTIRHMREFSDIVLFGQRE